MYKKKLLSTKNTKNGENCWRGYIEPKTGNACLKATVERIVS